ncbi:hypothetical protein IMZ48_17165 [Candidatus Bathyarchaeota archaeon]|nr:hypothetical protein [Candidatus Bathyarchaeota archaeon]
MRLPVIPNGAVSGSGVTLPDVISRHVRQLYANLRRWDHNNAHISLPIMMEPPPLDDDDFIAFETARRRRRRRGVSRAPELKPGGRRSRQNAGPSCGRDCSQ